MIYVDPYTQDPRVASGQLGKMVAISLVFHGGLALFFLIFADGRFFFDAPPEKPPEIIQVSLVPPPPEVVPKRLPNKETSAPVEMESEAAVALPENSPEALPVEIEVESEPKIEEPEPKPEPAPEKKEEIPAPQPEKKAKPPQTLDDEARERLAALAKRLAKTQKKESPAPNPEAPLGAKDRVVASSNQAQPKSNSRAKVTTYEANSPEGRYLAEIKEKVISVWLYNQRLKREQPDLLVVVEVTLSGEGRILRPDIAQSSNHSSFDQSALRAVKMVSAQHRFPTPPQALIGETVGFRFSPGDGK